MTGTISFDRNPNSQLARAKLREKLRKKSEGQEGAKGGGKIFYREEKNGKVTYEFNATYRKPSDLGWVSAAAAEQRARSRKRSQNEEPESPEKEKIDMFDITTAKMMGKELTM